MFTIALTKSLAHLKYELENLGYNVLFEDEINSPVDALFIYMMIKDLYIPLHRNLLVLFI